MKFGSLHFFFPGAKKKNKKEGAGGERIMERTLCRIARRNRDSHINTASVSSSSLFSKPSLSHWLPAYQSCTVPWINGAAGSDPSSTPTVDFVPVWPVWFPSASD